MKRFLSHDTIFLFFIVCSLILMSCAARIDGSLSADGSAVMNVNVSLEPRMSVLIRSLSAAGGQTDAPVLNGPAISQSMSRAPGVASVALRNTASAAVEGQTRISQINEFLSAAGAVRNSGTAFIYFEQGGRVTGNTVSEGRCIININRQNGPVILELLSPEISDYLHALMAPLVTGEDLNKNEYLTLVSNFYSRAVSDEIAQSRIRASISFPGAITGIKGGTYSGRTAAFDIPLLDLLVVEQPLVYEVTWN